MTDEIELKPCPFCGSGNVRYKEAEHAVVCAHCKARGSIAPTEEMAIRMWGERAGEPTSEGAAMMEIEAVCAADMLPVRAHEADAGADLRASRYEKFMPGEIKTVPTDVRVAIPKGYVGLLFARSSLCNLGVMLANGVGVIDSGYTGEIKVPLFNASPRVFELPASARIAQLVILPCELPTFRRVESLEETERGEGGFGSTGVE